MRGRRFLNVPKTFTNKQTNSYTSKRSRLIMYVKSHAREYLLYIWMRQQLLISILPKNHAGPVEKLISDFFRMPKTVGAIDSL